jgi:hypothetical protein
MFVLAYCSADTKLRMGSIMYHQALAARLVDRAAIVAPALLLATSSRRERLLDVLGRILGAQSPELAALDLALHFISPFSCLGQPVASSDGL